MINVQCIAVGDGSVGKTCLLKTFTTKKFPNEHVLTILEHQSAIVRKGDRTIHLILWDTAGQECLHIRKGHFPIQRTWITEVIRHCPDPIMVLVGTKLDLREDTESIEKLKARGELPITHRQGVKLAEKIGAYRYLECSALNRVGLDEVFDAALTAVAICYRKPPKKRTCTIL